MTVAQFLAESTKALQHAGIDSARLDTLVLLEDILERDRSSILAHPELVLTGTQLRTLNKKIIQRSEHMPLGYIRGHVAFFGRDFTVNNHVLIPRPETEGIIELLKTCPLPERPQIADIGTGSGCIGITAALELPGSRIDFYDTDQAALETAQANARRLQVSGAYYLEDMLSTWHNNYDIVLANLPYVPDLYPINKAATFEPVLALFSGTDGLAHYRRFWEQISNHTPRTSHVIIEALPEQHAALTGLAAKAAYRLQAVRGYAQHFTPLLA